MDIDSSSKSSVTINPRQAPSSPPPPAQALLPTLLHTPGGLALLELQGEFNLPPDAPSRQGEDSEDEEDQTAAPPTPALSIGRIEFPDYDATATSGTTSWMGCVHLYVGPHQRLTGEAKRLPRPLAVVRRRQGREGRDGGGGGGGGGEGEETDEDEHTDLEIVDVIYYKLLFSQRPEPMTESLD